MFEQAKKYYSEYGDLEVPARFITNDGYSLGHWIYNQRAVRKGQQTGNLSEEQIEKLNSIGMRWDLYTDYSWEKNFNAAKDYYEKNGHLDVPSRFVTRDGLPLGAWLSSLRTWKSSGIHPKYLSAERKKQLESIGMIWSKLDYYWEQNFSEALRYYRKNGDLLVPSNFVTDNGMRLGSWIFRQRKLHSGSCKGTPLTAEQTARLNSIGMVWEPEDPWLMSFNLVKGYYKEHGNINISQSTVVNGVWLGKWIAEQKKRLKSGKHSDKQREYLNNLPLEDVSNIVQGSFSCIIDNQKYEFFSNKDFENKMSNINYIVISVGSENDRLCFELQPRKAPITGMSSEWVKNYKEKIGSGPGFFLNKNVLRMYKF